MQAFAASEAIAAEDAFSLDEEVVHAAPPPIENLAGTMMANNDFVEGDFTQRPLELTPLYHREVITRTAHVEGGSIPTTKLAVGDRMTVVVFTDRAPADSDKGETELQIVVPLEVRELALEVWLVTTRHFAVDGSSIELLTIERDVDRSEPVHFSVTAVAPANEFSEEPEVRVSFSYNGWPCGRVTRPVPLVERAPVA